MANKLILVVEDSPTDKRIAVSACEQAGYKVITAGDGEEALRMTVDHKPDLILLDVILPKKMVFRSAGRSRAPLIFSKPRLSWSPVNHRIAIVSGESSRVPTDI